MEAFNVKDYINILVLTFLVGIAIPLRGQDLFESAGLTSQYHEAGVSQLDTSTLRSRFLQLCDSAVSRLKEENRNYPFFIDSYSIRGLCVAYDMTGNQDYLNACRQWSDKIVDYQKGMIPAGAYYMNYGRKPGEDTGDWYVADCSSIAMGVLATSVRCSGLERERLLSSVKRFALMVMKKYLMASGGVTDGLWPDYNGPWWCSSALFGSLLFMLYKDTRIDRYLNAGLKVVNWLNKLDLAKAGPLPLSNQGPSMPMYVLECYSAGWPYIMKDSIVKNGAVGQVTWCLEWVKNQQQKPVSQREWQITSWWGAKYGGLPFHQYIYSHYFNTGWDLSADADHEMQRISDIIFSGNLNLPQLEAFMMMSFAERLDPGSIYRLSNKPDAKAKTVSHERPTLSIDERVKKLISLMTLKEKIELLGGIGFETRSIDRLGIPELKMTDGALGVRWGKSTAFPCGMSMAATWNTDLVMRVGEAIAEEAKAKGRDVLLGPNVNIARVPLNGRTFEAFGEDPYLTSQMAVNYIKGVQHKNVIATVKHFCCNNQEYNRGFVNAIVDPRALHEVYLPAFKAAVKDGHVLAVMAAYNKVNGVYCSENSYLLTTELRKSWGFKGLVMSDWGAVHSSIPTVNSGLDLEMPTGKHLNDSTLTDAIKKGLISEETINNMVSHILYVMFKAGLFKHHTIRHGTPTISKIHKEIAYKAACEGIVLLKNEKEILPLKVDRIKSIALIGPGAAIARTGGGGSSYVTPAYSVSPISAFRLRLGNKVKINYALGVRLDGDVFPIDSAYLFLPEWKKHGLLGEYFENTELKGKPIFTRVDPEVDFNWGGEPPSKGFRESNFSVRWTGYVKPPKTCDYTFQVLSSDGAKLYIDDKLVINNWTDHAASKGGGGFDTCNLKLEGGKKYKLRLEYFDHWGQTIIKLGWYPTKENLLREAVEAASKSDVAIIFASTSDYFESEGWDRNNLLLPDDQDKLVEEISKVNKNVIVVLTTGAPVTMNRWVNNVKAILEAWFGGSESGNAIADVIMGNVNPSGKLPITFPVRWEDCSAYSSYRKQDSVSVYSEGIFVGYKWFDKNNIAPLFPFGYGLSYTSFSYRNMKIDSGSANGRLLYKVSFDLQNIGKRKGVEVPQLYVGATGLPIQLPLKQLRGFQRISLNPGETKRVEFTIKRDAFSYYDVKKGMWVVEPGRYDISVGSSSRDIRLNESVMVK